MTKHKDPNAKSLAIMPAFAIQERKRGGERDRKMTMCEPSRFPLAREVSGR